MSVDESFLQARIRADNDWWKTAKIPFFNTLGKRRYYEGFFKGVQQAVPHRAVVLMGPRRVGKTVMMYQAIADLLAQGIPAEKIAYFSLDTPIYNNLGLEELVLRCNALHGHGMDGAFFFFDEVQYLKDWEVHLKSLVDRYRNTKFVVSGSAAAALRMKSIESGAGRFTDYFLPPLTFAEYIDLNGYQHLLQPVEVEFYGKQPFYQSPDIATLNQHFVDYINFGGFPEIALNASSIEHPERVIQKDITERVIMKDLPGLFGIENVLELQQFFNVLSFRTGEILNYNGVAQETRTDNKTIKKYITYLEAAYLMKVLHRVDVTAKRFKNITQFKVYLTNPSLFTGLFGSVRPGHERFPHLVETAVFAQYLHREHEYLRYANWRTAEDEGEVDLIQLKRNFQGPLWAVEVKWSDKQRGKHLLHFMKRNSLSRGIITSKTVFEEGDNFLVVPNSVFAYVVGKRALERLGE